MIQQISIGFFFRLFTCFNRGISWCLTCLFFSEKCAHIQINKIVCVYYERTTDERYCVCKEDHLKF